MSLLEIKNHMMQVRICSLANLCLQFNNCDENVLRDKLAHWLKKGCLRKFSKTAACGGSCQKCPAASIEVYEWVA